MKNISNWFVGSFFRTLGRFLAIGSISILIYILASKSGLKLSNLLGIDTIYADTGSYSSSTYAYRLIQPSENGDIMELSPISKFVAINTTSEIPFGSDSYYRIGTTTFRAYTSDSNKWKSGNNYNFKWRVCQSEKWSSTSEFNQWKNGVFLTEYTYNKSNAATGATTGNKNDVTYTIVNEATSQWCWNITFNVSPVVDLRYIGFEMVWTPYYFNNDGLYTGQNFRVESLTIDYTGNSDMSLEDSTNSIINNDNENTDRIIDSQNDIKDTLTDDKIEDSEISDSLNFDTSEPTAYGPFSSFLLLPLTWVQQILVPTDSCRSIDLPLPYVNKNLTLPCMNEFWNSLGGVADLISLVWIAVVGVRIFNGLYLLVVDTTSSEDNGEYLDKVRSWEL